MAEFELLASAAFGMEALVVRELAELGYPNARVDDGRVRFRGDLSAICRANLWLRCAERVQVVVADFPARNFDDLFDQIKVLPWEEWLSVDAKFPVTARCVRSDIRSVPNTQKMVKRAIVERLRKVYSRHWFAETGVQYDIEAIILADRALLTIDTTGEGLHKRGYRHLVGRAPLRETVAAAMVKLSYWNRDRLLVDPFCGSGTIPIEAALIGRNLAPGRNRSFSAEQWGQIPRTTWTAARQEVKDLEIRKPLGIPIVATDRDRSAIRMAVQHARRAGVETEIHFEEKDFVAFPTHRDAGVLICNPPYGERLGEEGEVRQLYRDMGELLRPLDDWSLYILTSAEGFEREFGKQADRRRKLYNARIACTFYQYLGPKPAGTTPIEGLPAAEALPDGQPEQVEPSASRESSPWNRPQDEPTEKVVSVEEKIDRGQSAASVKEQEQEQHGGSPSFRQSVRPQSAPVNPWATARRPQGSSPKPAPREDRPLLAEDLHQEDRPTIQESAPIEVVVEKQPADQPPAPQPIVPEPPVGDVSVSPGPLPSSVETPQTDSGFASSPPPVASGPVQSPQEPESPQSSAPEKTESAPPAAKTHPWKKNPWQR